MTRSESSWDAVIVGGGHNGLVAAFYLARAGCGRWSASGARSSAVAASPRSSRRFRASTGAYVLSMLREPVWRDLRLLERGILVDPAGPSLNLYADGSTLELDDDLGRTRDQVRRFSDADARVLADFEAELGRVAALITPLIDDTPPDPASLRPRDLAHLARLGGRAARHRDLLAEASYLFGTSATQYLSEWFESDQVMAALGWHAINDSAAGPSTPGTAFVLLHDHASEQAGGGIRQWGFVRGGIGRLTEAMADAAREAGATIRTGAEVDEVLVEVAVRPGSASRAARSPRRAGSRTPTRRRRSCGWSTTTGCRIDSSRPFAPIAARAPA